MLSTEAASEIDTALFSSSTDEREIFLDVVATNQHLHQLDVPLLTLAQAAAKTYKLAKRSSDRKETIADIAIKRGYENHPILRQRSDEWSESASVLSRLS